MVDAAVDWLDAIRAGARGLRPGGRFAATPVAPDAIVIVGATCAGKTTLVDAIRAAAIAGVDVPARRVTRPRRAGDHPAEAAARSAVEFAAEVATGAIALAWRRRLEAGREERYGFVPAAVGAVPVYSANNAILAAAAGLVPVTALDRALVIAIHAPDPVRAQRLRARSPDLWRDHPAEVALRLAEPTAPALAAAHVVIDNHGRSAAVAAAELVALVTAAVRR